MSDESDGSDMSDEPRNLNRSTSIVRRLQSIHSTRMHPTKYSLR